MGSEQVIEIIHQDYSVACTTRIVGLAAEECGRLSYDLDNVFDKGDLVDPDFPLTMADGEFHKGCFLTPADIISDIARERVEVVVETIGMMEKSWITMDTRSFTDKQRRVSTRLWEFVKDDAAWHVDSLFGKEYKEEFTRLGNTLFLV